MIYQIESHIAQKLIDFFDKFDFIDKVVVFGSRARHDCSPKSDIDLCIYSLEMTDIEFSKLKFELDELPILYKIDIVHFEKVNRELQDNVERDGKLLFKKILLFEEFFENIPAKKFQLTKREYLEKAQYPIIDQGQKFITAYSNNEDKLFKINKPVIIFGDHTRAIKYIDFDFIIGADGTKVLLTKKSIDTKFAYYNLLNTNIESLGYSRHFKLLKEKSFYLPTLTKQKKIANTLDKASELITLRKESIKKLDELSKSIFIDMFGDPVSNPKKWDKDNLKNLVVESCSLSYGVVQPGENFKNGIPTVRPVDLENNLKDISKLKHINPNISNKYKKTLLHGDEVLICVRGTTGIINYSNDNLKNANVTRGIIPIRFNDEYNKYFGFHVLLSKSMQQVIQEKTYGATLKQINVKDIRELTFIKPQKTLQNKFATIIEKIEEQKTLYEEELKKLQENFDALLQRSFS